MGTCFKGASWTLALTKVTWILLLWLYTSLYAWKKNTVKTVNYEGRLGSRKSRQFFRLAKWWRLFGLVMELYLSITFKWKELSQGHSKLDKLRVEIVEKQPQILGKRYFLHMRRPSMSLSIFLRRKTSSTIQTG